MSKNYNSTLQSNNTDLQAILNTINELPEAGGTDPVLQDKTVTPTTSKQTISADSGYDGLDTVTVNAMPTATQATPTITVNTSGLITATATQAAGYVTEGSKSGTKQLTTQAAKTVTPSKSNQTAVSSGVYTTGAITVAAIPSQYITTTDATAAAGEIFSGETAYVNGSKVTGTFTIDTELSTQDSLITQIQNVVNSLPDAGGSGGGSGSVETCTVTISPMRFSRVFYVNNGQVVTEELLNIPTKNLTVTKNTIMFIDSGWSESSAETGECNKLFYSMASAVYAINGDCTLIAIDSPT